MCMSLCGLTRFARSATAILACAAPLLLAAGMLVRANDSDRERSGWTSLTLGGSEPKLKTIDDKLFRVSHLIMKDLVDHGYKNVGVLKFQVKNGNSEATLTSGTLNYVMATRLENALILKNDDKAPIGITRGASAVAAANDVKATFLTEAGRQALLGQKYPLAWGTEKVQVDAFLTGIVSISPDAKSTKITIQAFDSKNLKLREILSFEAKTDTAIIRDTNQSFFVSRELAARAFSGDDSLESLNDLAVQTAQKQNKTSDVNKANVEKASKDYLDIKFKFDGQEVEIGPDGFLKKPLTGKYVVIHLKARVKLGLLLRVNGVNTLDDQSDEKANLADYSWWILEPNRDYEIPGFCTNGKVFPFIAKAVEEANVAEMGKNVLRHGKIDFDIFVDLGNKKVTTPDDGYSFRTVDSSAKSASDAKIQVREALLPPRSVKKDFIITKAGEGQDLKLDTTTFAGQHVAGLSVNFRSKLPMDLKKN